MRPLEVFDLNIRHLGAVVAVSKFGSIVAAAVEVNLSQPTLTEAIAKLEQRLGQRLFDRNVEGSVPTFAGRLFLGRTECAIDILCEAGRQLRRSARLPLIAHLERMVTATQLRAVLAVDRAKSFTGAAKEVGLSQPSIHRAAQELQLLLGVSLFLRNGHVLTTTMVGERWIRSVRLAMAEIQSGLDELAALVTSGAGRVTIGTLPLPRSALLPAALARFTRNYPRATLTVVEAQYYQMLTMLRAGDIDMILGALRENAPSEDVLQQPIFTDHLFVVGRVGHPLSGKIPSMAELAYYPWVVGARGAPMRAVWDGHFLNGPFPAPCLRIECSSVLVALGLMLNGDWLALLSPDQFRIEQQMGLLAPIGGALAGSLRQVGITTRRAWQPTAAQSAFLKTLVETGTAPIQGFGDRHSEATTETAALNGEISGLPQ